MEITIDNAQISNFNLGNLVAEFQIRDVEPEPLTDEQVACLDRLELEWKLLPAAGAEITIFGAVALSGNCNAPKKSDPFWRT
jgi:hypothetical protein